MVELKNSDLGLHTYEDSPVINVNDCETSVEDNMLYIVANSARYTIKDFHVSTNQLHNNS